MFKGSSGPKPSISPRYSIVADTDTARTGQTDSVLWDKARIERKIQCKRTRKMVVIWTVLSTVLLSAGAVALLLV